MGAAARERGPMPSEERADRRFPYFHELELPEGAEGWREMYPDQYLPGHTERAREYEDAQFWIQDPNIGRRALRPWDVTVQEALDISYPQNMSRVIPLPDTLSMDFRFYGGYLYITLVPLEDEELIEERLPLFEERIAYQTEHFEELYDEVWKEDVKAIVEELRAIEIPEEFPRYVADEFVTEGHGTTETLDVIEAYHRLLEGLHAGWQRHFEFMTTSYGAYLAFFEFCKDAFPGIPDQAIAKMTQALDGDLYRPDAELSELARLADDLGEPVTSILLSDDDPDAKLERLEETAAGREFLEAFWDASDPWFFMSYGAGFFSADGCWLDDLEAPFDHLRSKLELLAEGESIDRDVEGAAAERERLFSEYRSYLTDEEDRETFEHLYRDCRRVYRYLDDHNFWVDHYLDTVVFRKMRDIGALLVTHDMLEEPDDIFWFTQYEVHELLVELGRAWGEGQGGFVSDRWKHRVEERKEIHEALESWEPTPALGRPPAEVEDTLYKSHMGIDTAKVQRWLDELEGEDVDAEEPDVITGFGASEGVVEGVCRVVLDPEDLDRVGDGEILVAPATNPSWSPAFSRIAAAVTNTGGITHHAATVCREFGLPAVVGTEVATKRLRSGDRVRVDGAAGRVEILERAEG